MKNYPTKSLMFGYQIGLEDDHLYVAVPAKYFFSGAVNVNCQGENKIFTADDKAIASTFKDKFKKGKDYELYYFKWED